MYKFILFFILFFVSQATLAQSEKKSHLTISAGPSFPLDKFKSKDFYDGRAGFANTGTFLNLNVAYGYMFSKHLGGTALLKGRMYGVDLSYPQTPQ